MDIAQAEYSNRGSNAQQAEWDAAQTGARVRPARQPSAAAYPAATQPGGHSGPSPLLPGLIAGLATAGVVIGLTRWRRWWWKRRGNL